MIKPTIPPFLWSRSNNVCGDYDQPRNPYACQLKFYSQGLLGRKLRAFLRTNIQVKAFAGDGDSHQGFPSTDPRPSPAVR
jgi:hypothetical protein